jgi:flagellar motor switch protein FliG
MARPETHPGRRTSGTAGGRRKAAILLIALGPEVAAAIFKALGEDEVDELSAEVAAVGEVTPEERRAVIEEFHALAERHRLGAAGGPAYARDALARSFGDARAAEILARASAEEPESGAFRELDELDPATVRDLLAGEHPQTVAVVLAHLRPEKAARVVALLPGDLAAQALTRAARLGPVPGEVLAEIQSELRARAVERPAPPSPVEGSRIVARILNSLDREMEERMLAHLEAEDRRLAESVQRQLFVFEDLLKLDSRAIQKVLRSIDARTLAVALKASTAELRERIFANMSRRAGEMLRSEIDILGAVRLNEVEATQSEVVAAVRQLERDGEIVVPRGDMVDQAA